MDPYLSVPACDVLACNSPQPAVRAWPQGQNDAAFMLARHEPPKEVTDPRLDASFAMRYLLTFAKCSAFSDEVALSLTAGMPVTLEYSLGGGGLARFFLAPKVSDSDDEGESDGEGEGEGDE
jgi:hypothetical protein